MLHSQSFSAISSSAMETNCPTEELSPYKEESLGITLGSIHCPRNFIEAFSRNRIFKRFHEVGVHDSTFEVSILNDLGAPYDLTILTPIVADLRNLTPQFSGHIHQVLIHRAQCTQRTQSSLPSNLPFSSEFEFSPVPFGVHSSNRTRRPL